MLGRRVLEVIDITNGGAQIATGNRGIQARLTRRSNLRLETAILHVNFDLTATTRTAARNSLDGFFDEVRVKVSDAGGAGRFAIKAPSAALINWNRDRIGRAGRFTQNCLGRADGSTWPVTKTGYDLFVPLHFYPQNLNSVIANRFSLPLTDRIGANGDVKGIDDDVLFEFDVHSSLANIGLSAGSVTVRYCKLECYMREVAGTVPYVPTQLDYAVQNAFTSNSETTIDVPSGGYLMAYGVDEFSSATARGDALDTTPATLGFWKLRYGRTELQTYTTKQLLEWNEGWIQAYPDGVAGFTVERNSFGFHVNDLLHDVQIGDAWSGNSCLNLYTENKGDSAKLVATRPVTNSQIGTLWYKMFGPITALDAA